MPVREHTKVYKTRVNRDEINRATYRKLFRFDKGNVEWLAETFLPENYETRGGCLTQVQRMQTTLAYLADPGYQTSVAQKLGISQATVSRCVADSLERISARQSTWIKFPVSNADVANTKQWWAEKLGFPVTLGAIDCTHVRIDKPGGQFGDDFINRKNFPSFNVQATCDQNYTFTGVDVGWPGSVHDARIFQTSELHEVISRQMGGFLWNSPIYDDTVQWSKHSSWETFQQNT